MLTLVVPNTLKIIKIVKWLTALIVISFLILCLRPVPSLTSANARTAIGIVKNITEGGIKDAVFHLENNDRIYYINRGFENGLDLSDLKNKLLGREVRITYPHHWTPLDWNGKAMHMSRLEIGEEIVFEESKRY